MDDLASVVEESQREQKLPRDALHKRDRNARPREEPSEAGHVWAHGLEDEADVLAVGADVFKAVEKAQNVLRPWRRHASRLDRPQDVHFERVMLVSIRVRREQLQRDMPFCPVRTVSMQARQKQALRTFTPSRTPARQLNTRHARAYRGPCTCRWRSRRQF